MNLDNEEKKKTETDAKASKKKKLTRKEKKALKKAASNPPVPEAPKTKKTSKPAKDDQEAKPEEVDVKLDRSPVQEIPAPHYSTWEKISPPARRKKQITNMESGFREVLALVHSMRNNQEVLLDAFQKLPEAVDSVKKLADHSAQQSDLLKAMNAQMGTGSAGDFNKTLSSMDQTTQLLLERAQHSEEQLFGMLKSAQRRITFMTLLVVMLFLGAVAAFMFVFFPEKTEGLLNKDVPIPAPISQESSVEMDESVAIISEETAAESPKRDLVDDAPVLADPETIEDVSEAIESTMEEVKDSSAAVLAEASETLEFTNKPVPEVVAPLEDTGGEDTGGEDTGGEDTGGEDTGGEDTGGEDTKLEDPSQEEMELDEESSDTTSQTEESVAE